MEDIKRVENKDWGRKVEWGNVQVVEDDKAIQEDKDKRWRGRRYSSPQGRRERSPLGDRKKEASVKDESTSMQCDVKKPEEVDKEKKNGVFQSRVYGKQGGSWNFGFGSGYGRGKGWGYGQGWRKGGDQWGGRGKDGGKRQ